MVRIDRHLVALRYKLFLGLFLAVTMFLLGYVTVAHAQDATTPDAACRLCHGDQAETLPLPSGESLTLGVDLATLDQSVHGVQSTDKLYCTDCHQPRQRYLYPHEPSLAQNLAEFVAEIDQNCEQ
jgi:formate-dependent nitrite reductase cytochrome c552 subunit